MAMTTSGQRAVIRTQLEEACKDENIDQAKDLHGKLKGHTIGKFWSQMPSSQLDTAKLLLFLAQAHLKDRYNDRKYKINGEYPCGDEEVTKMVNFTALRHFYSEFATVAEYGAANPDSKCIVEHPIGNGFFQEVNPRTRIVTIGNSGRY